MSIPFSGLADVLHIVFPWLRGLTVCIPYRGETRIDGLRNRAGARMEIAFPYRCLDRHKSTRACTAGDGRPAPGP